MTEIPASLTTLVNLQVLNMSNCTLLERLPGDIEKLVNLRHLYLDGYVKLTHMPKGIGKLTSLLTLDLFIVADPSEFGGEVVAVLEELRQLNFLGGELTIKGVGSLLKTDGCDDQNHFLKEKMNLKSLTLIWDYGPQDVVATEALLERLHPEKKLSR
ncbi:unnamed protein product [Linum trigynum]|uniref:Disease resistance R13L4/SHOC-2-like LRR domain-containing protein n=1 Tax=Linum trigynum TaxID=586398 RepID=A0AAV2GCD3_9ROSI